MEDQFCRNCEHGQLVRVRTDGTHRGADSSDAHFDLYTCHFRRAEHFGHVMIGEHACIGFGFKQMDLEKGR
jgi:hypothetical protein